ncbi:MAG: DUF4886 domain-containing protein [Bacteroidaceae bacterium]|nr:DUF4886 domain-containing protein [Bacteroidaceae bacterium]
MKNVKIAVVLMFLATSLRAQTPQGDLNHNGVIDLSDVTLLIEAYLNKDTNPDPTQLPDTTVHDTRSIRILSIGNSYSMDALFYLPRLVSSITNEVNIAVGIAYYSSATLKNHAQLAESDSKSYTFYHCDSTLDHWKRERNLSLADILSTDWDFILLQQSSFFQSDYNSYQPWLDQLTSFVQQHQPHGTKLGWLLCPAFAQSRIDAVKEDGTKSYNTGNYTTSDEHFAAVAQCAQNVLSGNNPVSFVVPAGTAIQNARHIAELDTLGTTGNLTFDYVHTQDGLPRMIQAYTLAQTLFDLCGIAKGIWGNSTVVSEEWLKDAGLVTAWAMRKGAPVGSLPQYYIGQQCTISAIKHPFVISAE